MNCYRHAYSVEAITRAAHAGVRTIEHGNLIDEPTARLMASNGMYLIANLVTYYEMRKDLGVLQEQGKFLAAIMQHWHGIPMQLWHDKTTKKDPGNRVGIRIVRGAGAMGCTLLPRISAYPALGDRLGRDSMKRKSLDRRLAKQHPERVFDSPRDIVAETLFTKGEKLGTLNRWRLSIIDDLSANAVASQRAQILGQIEEAKCRLTDSPA